MRPLISLDIFDTAIFRKVYRPTDIFTLVEREIGEKFKAKRIEAQNKSRRKDINYTLLDIYKEMTSIFNPKYEIEVEYDNCEANPYILDMYNNIEADFIFISDMYLPSSVLVAMLKKCGYKDPKVFVSCEMKALKQGGELFRKVEEKLGRKIDKHIGDNYMIDIQGALRANIREVEYVGPSVYNREVITPELENPKLRKLLIDEELGTADIEERVGYTFAPLILAFVKNVLDEAKDDQTIFFNARDGFIMYVVARWILKTKKKIKYCRFSRKSCHLPNINPNRSLSDAANAKALSFFKTLRLHTIRDFLEMFNLDKDYSKELEEVGITLETDLEFNSKKNKIMEKFVTLIQKDILKRAREERKKFVSYVNTLGMKDMDIFVDLGHFGSMQSIIRRITGIELKGMYTHTFNLTKDYFEGIHERKISYLQPGSLSFFTGIIELVFSEPVGTVIGYTLDGKTILNNDTKFRKDVTKKILKGIIKGSKEILEEDIEPTREDSVLIINRFLYNPTLEEANFGNSKLFENGSLSKNESIVWFDEDWIKRGKIKECYNRSYWRQAFKLLLENSNKYRSLERFIK